MISPPSKFSSPDCTNVRELAVQIYDIYYLMQNNFAHASFAYTFATFW